MKSKFKINVNKTYKRRRAMNEKQNSLSRRHFIQDASAGALAGIAATTATSCLSGKSGEKAKSCQMPRLKAGDVILFQGDSITDGGRNRAEEHRPNYLPAMGQGYVLYIAEALLSELSPLKLSIYNRGISGDEVLHLAKRWDKDCLELKPTVLSILIGVNDYWHIRQGKVQGSAEEYFQNYQALLDRTRKALPNCRLVIGEPFVLNCGAVNDSWFAEFGKYQKGAMELAGQFKACFIPYQEIFDQASKKASPAYWAEDGVHPTAAGAGLMAQAWLEAVRTAGA
jgi:lysophospholipase L1-like esterase